MADFTQDLNDSPDVSDVIAKGSAVPAIDSLNCADSVQRGSAKSAIELVAVTDSFLRRVVASRAFSAIVSIAESITRQRDYRKTFAEAAIAITERISSRGLGRLFLEAVTLLDGVIWPSSPRIMQTVDTSVRVMDVISLGD